MIKYQNSPLYVRLYRRLKYQPTAYLNFVRWFIKWLVTGCPHNEWINQDGSLYRRDSRWETLAFSWMIMSSDWHIKANWLYDWEPIKEILEKKYGHSDSA